MPNDKIISRLEEFVFRDDRSRWSCMLVSSGLAFVYALLAEFVWGRSGSELLIGTTLIVAIYQIAHICVYCLREEKRRVFTVKPDRSVSRVIFLRYAVSAGVLLFVALGDKLSAAITLSRIRENLEDDVTPAKLQQVAKITKNAHASGITLDRGNLIDIGDRIANVASQAPELHQEAQRALEALAAFSSSLKAPRNQNAFLKPWSLYDLPRHRINLQIPFGGTRPDVFAIGDFVAIPEGAYLVPLGTPPPTTGPQALLITGEHPSPGNATSTGIDIDGYSFHNVIFQDCALSYRGGQVAIDGAILIDSSLGVSVPNLDQAKENAIREFFRDAIAGMPASLKIP